MVNYARWSRFITDDAGNIVPNVNIEVRSETLGGSPLKTLYEDRAGGTPLVNPFVTGADGLAEFHTSGDACYIRAYTGPTLTPTWEAFFRYEGVGTAAEYDYDALLKAVPDGTVAAPGLAFAGDPDNGAYRIGANNWALAAGGAKVLEFTSSLVSAAVGISFGSSVALAGIVSPSQITGNQDNYAPTGIATASVLRLSSDASRNITGLSAGSGGEIKLAHNVGSQNIVLVDESGSSTAANRFALPADLTLAGDTFTLLQYDATTARWRGGLAASSSAAATIVNDTSTNATMYPAWVTTTSGNLPLKISSTKMFFNPSLGRLSLAKGATSFASAGTTSLHIQGDDTGEARIELTASGSDSVIVFGRLNGGFGTRNPIVNGDQIMGLIGTGIDTAGGTTMQQGPTVGIYAYENWNSGSHGSGYQFLGIKNATTALVNFMTLREQRAGFGTESNPQYGLTYSKHATTGIADPFGNDMVGFIGADGGGMNVALQTFGTLVNPTITMFRARGTSASKTAVSSGDVIGQFQAFGYAGSTSLYNGGAGFAVVANQTHSTGAAGTRLDLTATPDGSTTQATAASVYGEKSLFVGSSPSALGAGVIGSSGSHYAHANTAIPAGGTAGAGYKLSSTANFGVFFGSGAPTLSAAKGSLYLRSDGSSGSTRAYINTDGGTTWTSITTAG